MRIERDAGDADPTAGLTREDVASERLGATDLRSGVKLLYLEQSARVTLSIDPDADDDDAWLAAMNRHHESLPEGDSRASVIEWFARSSSAFEQLLLQLLASPDHEQHAA